MPEKEIYFSLLLFVHTISWKLGKKPTTFNSFMYNTLSKLIGIYLPNSRVKSFHLTEFTASKKSFLWGIFFFFSYQTSTEKTLEIVFPLNLRNRVFIVSSILVFTMFSVFIANCCPSKGVTEKRSGKCSKIKRCPWNYLISLFNI